MRFLQTSLLAVLVFTFLGAFESSPRAAVLTTVMEQGGSVIFTSNGSIDLTDLVYISSGTGSTVFQSDSTTTLSISSTFITGLSGSGDDRYLNSFSSSITSFGTNPSILSATSSSGDYFGTSSNSINEILLVPAGYISGAVITGTATYASSTFASLGLTPGTYVWELTNADTITLQVGVVPLPPAVFLLGTALVGMAGFNRLKRRRAATA